MAPVSDQAAPPPPSTSHDPTSFYGNDLTALPIAKREDMPRPALSEIWKAADIAASIDLPSASRERVNAAWEPVIAQLNQGRPILHRFHNPGMYGANGEVYLTDENGSVTLSPPTSADLEQRAWNGVAAARQADPNAFPNLPDTLDEFRDSIVPQAKARLAGARETLSRPLGILGNATSLASGIVTGFRNPVNVAAMAYGGGEATIAKRVLGMALANAGAEAVNQPIAAHQRAAIGETLTATDAAVNVGTAFLGGAALQGADEVIAPGLSRLATEARTRLGNRMTPTENAAVHVLDRDAEVTASSPFTPGVGTEQHAQRLSDARQVLNTAPREALDTVLHVRASVDAVSDYLSRVRQVESGGNNLAANPRSSATGLYQMTDGTWLQLYKARFGAQAGDAAILARKGDTTVQDTLMRDLTAHNAAALDRIGAQQTAGNLYLMHFAGEAGGRRILTADPDEAISHILTPGAIKANPFLEGKTAGDVVAWAAAKMGDRGAPRLRRDLFASNDEWNAAQRAVDAEDAAIGRLDAEVAQADIAGQAGGSEAGPSYVGGRSDMPAVPEPSRLLDDADIRVDAGAAVPGAREEPLVVPRRETTTAEVATDARPTPPPATDTPYRERALVELRRFLADQGGIRNDEGHDLIAGRDLQSFVPGKGMLIREKGLPLDRARELAAEAGYFHSMAPEDAMARTTTSDFLDLLDSTGGGRDHYRLADLGRVADRDEARAYAANLERDLSAYDDPYFGSGAQSAMASLEHDVRLQADNDPDELIRLSDEGGEHRIADILQDLDADTKALAAARACM